MATAFGIAQAQSITSTGTQDFTASELGGQTPVGAIVFATFSDPVGTRVDHARLSIGVTDGTRERCVTGQAEDNVGTTNASVDIRSDRLVHHLNPSGSATDGIGVFSSFITDGIRINWTNAPSSPYSVVVILLAGSGISAYVDHIALGSQDVEIDVTAPGFEPSFLFAFSADRSMDGSGNDYDASYGIAINTVGNPQFDNDFNYDSGSASGDPRSGTLSNRIGSDLDNWRAEIDNFDANGFSVFPRSASGGGDALVYLAVKLDTGDQVAGFLYDTPTSTGNFAQTGIGFQPDLVFLGISTMEVRDSRETDAQAGSFGFGVFSTTKAFSGHITTEDGAATSDTSSMMNSRAAHVDRDNKATGIRADFVSMDSDGFTLDFTDVLSPTRRWWGLALKADVPVVNVHAIITDLKLIGPDARREGRISHAVLELPRLPGLTEVVHIKLKNFNRDLLLEELGALDLIPDLGLFFTGFVPTDDSQRIWTPITDIQQIFEDPAPAGEVILRYSVQLTAEDLTNIEAVLDAHDSTQRTSDQIEADQDVLDLARLRELLTLCPTLSAAEQEEAICLLIRMLLRFNDNFPP